MDWFLYDNGLRHERVYVYSYSSPFLPPPKNMTNTSTNLPSLLPLTRKLVRSNYFTVHFWATTSEYILVNRANTGQNR